MDPGVQVRVGGGGGGALNLGGRSPRVPCRITPHLWGVGLLLIHLQFSQSVPGSFKGGGGARAGCAPPP